MYNRVALPINSPIMKDLMERKRATTLRDVAERAGVSKMAVSAALAGYSGSVRLSESTRARILEAANDLGYTPNEVARSLRRQRTDIIALYCGYGYLNARLPFLSEIIGGVQEACDEYHKDLLLHGVFRGQSVEDIHLACVSGKTDGLILNAAAHDPLVQKLAQSHLPVIAIIDPIEGLPSVCVSDEQGARLTIDYLSQLGHKHVLYFTRGTLPALVSVERRRDAFLKAAVDASITVTECGYTDLAEMNGDLLLSLIRPAASKSHTAAVCWNDAVAYELLTKCVQLGIRVPTDLAIIGFDGLGTQIDSVMQLTSVRAPWAQVARTAVALLTAQIAGENVPEETVLPVELQVGSTT